VKKGFQGIQNTLSEMNGNLADASARKYSVTLTKKDESSLTGHGIIVELKKSYYILSAAHVIVTLADKEEVYILVEFVGHSDKKTSSFEVTCSSAFVSKVYVEKGLGDVGLLLITSDLSLTSEVPSFLDVETAVGQQLLGHGLVHLRGNALGCDEGRVLIHTPSVPGCSGAPLFAPRGEIVAVVHGNSKHRLGRHVFSHQDSTMSPHLYADGLDNISVLRVPSKFVQLLKDAENVDIEEEWAISPATVPEELPPLWNSVSAHWPEEEGSDTKLGQYSLLTLMEKSAGVIWASNPTALTLKEVQLCCPPIPIATGRVRHRPLDRLAGV
jgi:hypothetical protein